MSILTQIGTSGIKANAVTTDKILDAAVTTPKIDDGDVTNAKLAADAIPEQFTPGMILMWSGTIATIPTGWGLCDGTTYAGNPSPDNDIVSPDLTDKFVIGADQDDGNIAKTNIEGSLTQTGGSKNAVVVSHNHQLQMLNSSVGNAQIYEYYPTWHPQRDAPWPYRYSGAGAAVKTTGVSGTNKNLPPYYAIAYIIKKPV